MKRSLLLSFFIACIFVQCSSDKKNEEGAIVNPADYASYLNRKSDDAMKKLEGDMAFCREKLKEVPDSRIWLSKLAGLYSAKFSLNGKIEEIFTSDSIYHAVQNRTKEQLSSIHRALAANCITQHQFKEAHDHIEKALAIGDNKMATNFMLVDVDVELGNLDGARATMKTFANPNMFPWLIREAKIKDHEGKLDSAILLMEKALAKVEKVPSTSLWTLSNLADMYGHEGRITDAYNMYLQVLKIDPDYDYALKGIAWIAYSHDHNYAEAKKIATWISEKRATPDMHLFLAQIAGAENNISEKTKQLSIFTKLATDPRYGDMYNKYIALLEAEEFSNPAKTLTIAEREIHNRPTPQSFDLLAWAYFNSGEVKQALIVAREHIENKTWEPDAMYHLGMIYEANGMKAEGREYLEKAAKSTFELGPDKARIIKNKLSS